MRSNEKSSMQATLGISICAMLVAVLICSVNELRAEYWTIHEGGTQRYPFPTLTEKYPRDGLRLEFACQSDSTGLYVVHADIEPNQSLYSFQETTSIDIRYSCRSSLGPIHSFSSYERIGFSYHISVPVKHLNYLAGCEAVQFALPRIGVLTFKGRMHRSDYRDFKELCTYVP